MKAMVLYKFGEPLKMDEVKTPKIGSDEVLVRVKACGVCHTDLKIYSGEVPTVTLPHIMGHEVAGDVVEVGERVENLKEGDSVVLYPYITCGNCYYCRISRENICENLFTLGRIGFEVNGGFAEYVRIPARNAFKFSEKLSYEKVAVLPDAVVAPFRAIQKQGRVKAGDDVVIIGLGGLGIHGVQIAKALGARVLAVDILDEKVRLAEEFGADVAVNVAKTGFISAVKKFTDGKGADVVVDFVGNSKTLKQGFESLKNGGKLVIVGYEYGVDFQIPPSRVVYYDLEIAGSRGGTRQDLADVIKLTEMGKIKPVVSQVLSLGDANKALELLKEGKVLGRIVLKV